MIFLFFYSANNTDTYSDIDKNEAIDLWPSPPLSPVFDPDEMDNKDVKIENDDTDGTCMEANKDHVQQIASECKEIKNENDGKGDGDKECGTEDDKDLENNSVAAEDSSVKDAEKCKSSPVAEDESNANRDLNEKSAENSKDGMDGKDTGDSKNDKNDENANKVKENKQNTTDELHKGGTNPSFNDLLCDENDSDDQNELTDEASEREEQNDNSECSTSTGTKASSEQSQPLSGIGGVETKKVWEM